MGVPDSYHLNGCFSMLRVIALPFTFCRVGWETALRGLNNMIDQFKVIGEPGAESLLICF